MLNLLRGTVYWMSPETDHPSQRTVAELLAEYGNTGATGRRRRRREVDEPDERAAPPTPVGGTGVGTGPAAPEWPPAASEPGPSALRGPSLRDPEFPQQSQREPTVREPRSWEPLTRDPYAAPSTRAPWNPPSAEFTPLSDRQALDHVPDQPTELMPRIRANLAVGPLQSRWSDDAQPGRGAGTDLDDPADADRDGVGDTPSRDEVDVVPPTQAVAPLEVDDLPAESAVLDIEHVDSAVEPEPADEEPDTAEPDRSSTGPAWAAVLAQWIVGAIGGAALWVGFRFLWRDLPVVALAAAVLVTAGLVVVVRALLRNDDMRTTVFAVLVGLLLTVSPAILVLLGR